MPRALTSSHPTECLSTSEQESFTRTEAHLREHDPAARIIALDGHHPSIEEVANTLEVEPGQVAKALLVTANTKCVLLVIPGDARLDNRKFRDQFGARPRFLPVPDTERLTGHPIGGIGPFGHTSRVPVFCDRTLLDFALVYPAAGTCTRVAELTPVRLAALANAQWVDVCQ
jgi:prolyl-tRNA editing enzyme YbaK/EbsC (Cys-tRNA(Pro) deacylase)